MDTIFWLSPSIESCNWIDFISVAYASWYHWNCGRTQRKAAAINQFACPSYSLYVQLLWYPMYYPGGMKARVSPVQWLKPHSIIAPTQDSNPGGRIQNHKQWLLHYTTTTDTSRLSGYWSEFLVTWCFSGLQPVEEQGRDAWIWKPLQRYLNYYRPCITVRATLLDTMNIKTAPGAIDSVGCVVWSCFEWCITSSSIVRAIYMTELCLLCVYRMKVRGYIGLLIATHIRQYLQNEGGSWRCLVDCW